MTRQSREEVEEALAWSEWATSAYASGCVFHQSDQDMIDKLAAEIRALREECKSRNGYADQCNELAVNLEKEIAALKANLATANETIIRNGDCAMQSYNKQVGEIATLKANLKAFFEANP